jgi:hypothetical protein
MAIITEQGARRKLGVKGNCACRPNPDMLNYPEGGSELDTHRNPNSALDCTRILVVAVIFDASVAYDGSLDGSSFTAIPGFQPLFKTINVLLARFP